MTSKEYRLSRNAAGLGLLAIVLVVSLFAALGSRAAGSSSGSGASGPGTGAGKGAAGATASAGRSATGARAGGAAPVIFLDPGHGGVDTGTVGTTADGTEVDEKTVTLAIAQRTAAKLQAAGYKVVMSRSDDSLPGLPASDLTPDGQSLTAQGVLDDLQRRIDAANASGASLLLSIHLNSYDDPSVGGSETYYDPSRPFAANNQRFANLVQQDLIGALHAAGYGTPDRGVIDDTTLQAEGVGPLEGSYNHLVLLGPAIPGKLRPSNMPGALSESLFLSDPAEASAAVDPGMQDLIAGAFTKAVEDYFAGKS